MRTLAPFAVCMLAACGSQGDALVVVSLTSSPPLADIDTFHVQVVAAGRPAEFDITPPGAPITLSDEQNFGVDVPEQYAVGNGHVAVTAKSGERVVGFDEKDFPLAAGRRVDVPLDLSPSSTDGGTDAGATVAIAPSSFLFATTSANKGGGTKTFVVTNTGTSAGIASANLVGADFTSFHLIDDQCAPVVLQVGDSCNVLVQFTPVGAGMKHATLTVGSAASAIHGQGLGTWTDESIATDAGLQTTLYAVWGSSADDVYAAGSGGYIFHRIQGGIWAAEHMFDADLHGLWGSGPDSVYAVGNQAGNGPTILHRSAGGTWFPEVANASDLRQATSVWGSSATDIYIGLYGGGPQGNGILHSAGTGTWGNQNSGYNTFGLWGSSATDIYAVGASPTGQPAILHSAGNGMWTAQSQPASGVLSSIWANSPTDIFAAGASASPMTTVLHSSGGGAWSLLPDLPVTINVNGVWSAASDDVFVVGTLGAVFHFNGEAWESHVPNDNGHVLHAVWGSGPGDVYAVGDAGTIVHYH